ncbi:GNAT family N-acetyltransferase [Streptomyces sp. NPDC047072]|uniref:GNAT family N-acetyltransferase n=1 Tax=Streptomyces sp. NPDC047072 TaxID=3154809 RepID=UPI00340D7669
MPPADARATADSVPLSRARTRTCAVPDPDSDPRIGTGPNPNDSHTASATRGQGNCEDTLELRLPQELLAPRRSERTAGAGDPDTHPSDDLLDGVAHWGPVPTSVGVVQLVPVHVEQDLPLISRWMNTPAVAEFWELAGPRNRTESHLRSQLGGDGRSVPCLGTLDGRPMSYWEIYRADLDPLARHYPARPHDTGIHLLIGAATDRGRGLGTTLLRTVADLVLDRRPACTRVVAEPDLINIPSVAAFLSAGFRFSAEIDLPAKWAALMVRDRSLRDVL